jgi:adenosylcobinamide-GDP ribazoletransferase
VREIWLGIKFSLSYFTLLPVRFREEDDLSGRRVLSSMLAFFPVIGVILSALSIGLFLALESLGWFAAILAGVIYMVLYGFIHTEAVIDVADAAYAAHSGKDPYAVIKEPTVGAMGVLYGGSFLILKIAALSTLLMHHLFWPFVAISLVSRLGLLWLVRTHAFRSSFVSQLRESLSVPALTLFTALYAALGMWMLGWPFVPLLGCGIAVMFLLAALMKKALGFLNGDTLGASLEGSELALMIGVLALWS